MHCVPTERPVPGMDAADRRILDRLQNGLPRVHRPYRQIAQELDLEEADVIQRVRRMRRAGYIRRLGVVINNDALDRSSALAVLHVPADRVDAAAAAISAHPSVTHNYLRYAKNRELPYNVWFTFTAPTDEEFWAGLRDMEEEVGLPIHALRATKKFKVGVRFPIVRDADAPGGRRA